MDGKASAEHIDQLLQIASVGVLNLSRPEHPRDNGGIPEPELRLPQHDIIGRGSLLAEVLADIEAGARDIALEFLPGIGKTTVAAELIRHQASRSRFDGVLWAHLGQTPDVRGELLKWAEAVGLDEAAIAKRKTDGELGRAIGAKIGKRRVLLVIDDVWTSAAGQYFMLDGPNITRVLSSRNRGVARDLSSQVHVHVVPKLAPKDSLRLLRALAPHAAESEPAALQALAGRVDGLPLALVLLGRMLRHTEGEEWPVQALLDSLRDIRRMFAEKKPMEFAENSSFSMAEVVEVGYAQLGSSGLLSAAEEDGARLRGAVLALSVLRPDPVGFNEALALCVAEAPAAVLRQLAQAGMLERRASPQGAGEAHYTMHRMIAEYLRGKLPLDRFQALNARAARYYLDRLGAIEDQYQKRTQYLSLYRYENCEWRECQDNWLYHFAQAGYSRDATLAFLRVWLTAFWWWSCFTDEGFDFCDQLLNEWEHRLTLSLPEAGSPAAPQAESGARISRLLEGLDLLRRFKLAYPKETEDRSLGCWADVEASLTELRRRAQLDGAQPGAELADACAVRGLSSIFLAEAARFGRHDLGGAELLYEDALAQFRMAGDAWNQAWTLYHLADMLIEADAGERARPLCEEALQLGERERDPEVLALLRRALGDIARRGGDLAAARQHWALALQTAYLFQVRPEPPDAYTVTFYAELAEALAERLLALQQCHPEAARQMAEALRRPWLPLLPSSSCGALQALSGSPAELARRLFAPGLAVARLAAEGEAYGAQVLAQLEHMRDLPE